MMIPLEAYIASNFVKYERLSEIVPRAFEGYSDTHLNIYIDLCSTIRALYNHEYNTEITNYKSLTACIINMCIHYREYFGRYLGVSTTIYLVMGNVCSTLSRKFVPDYNNKMYNRITSNSLITELIKSNMELLNKMVPYLPNIYMIESEFEPAATISALIERDTSSDSNLIISRDVLNLQVVANYPKTALLHPSKSAGNDVSTIIGPIDTPNDIIEFWDGYVMMTTKSNVTDITISPLNVSMVMALTCIKNRGIHDRIAQIRPATKYIHNCVGDSHVRCSIKTLFEVNKELAKRIAPAMLEARHKALDAQFQKEIYKDTIQYKLINTVDLDDPAFIKRINDKLFFNDPIHLEKL